MLTREPKYLETFVNVGSLTTTPQVFALTDIAQGDNYFNRNGNLVQTKYLQYKMTCNQVGGTTPIIFKAAIVLDRQPNGVAPTFAQVFDTSVSLLPWTMKNKAAFDERFVILREQFGLCTAQGSDGAEGVAEGCIKFGGMKTSDQIIRWNGSAAASPNTNGIYLLIVAQTATVNIVQFTGQFRYLFNEQ